MLRTHGLTHGKAFGLEESQYPNPVCRMWTVHPLKGHSVLNLSTSNLPQVRPQGSKTLCFEVVQMQQPKNMRPFGLLHVQGKVRIGI